MHPRISPIWLAISAVTLLSMRSEGAENPLRVVTTTSDLRSIVEGVGGRHVSVTSLDNGQEDPHFIQAKPSYMMAARKADLWVRVGLELEIGYEGLILDGSRNGKIRVRLDRAPGRIRRGHPPGAAHPEGGPLDGRRASDWATRTTGSTRGTEGSLPTASRDRLKTIDAAACRGL